MTGVAKRLSSKGEIKNREQLRYKYDELISTEDYKAAVETGTSQEANVQTRLKRAATFFARVK